jgi:glycosyltransferase involved in cell wall biosynthesis
METSGEPVSVVIPTHYRNEWLAEAIESVLAQTYEPVEVVVVDDSGERHAEAVVDGYDVTYIAHESNRGHVAALNTGLDVASGTYVQLLDDDDVVRPEKFERQVALMEADERVDVVGCGIRDGDRPILPEPDHRGDALRAALTLRMSPLVTSAMLVRRSALEPLLPLRDRPGRTDVGWRIELAQRTRFDYVNEVLVEKRAHGDQQSDSMAARREDLVILDEYDHLFDRFPSRFRWSVRHRIHRGYTEAVLAEEGWSSSTVTAALRTCYYALRAREPDLGTFGLVVAATLGHPGYRLLRPIHTRLTGR